MARRVAITTGARVLWLVEVSFGGGVVRMSTEDIVVETSSGAALRFVGCLPELEVAVGLSQIGGVQDAPALSFEAVWPVAVAELVEAGHPLAFARATVSRWVEGSDYDDRRIVVDGYVQNPSYGEEDEPTGVTIEAPPWQATAVLPPTGHQVTGYTFASSASSLAPEQLGRLYPVVFGSPGMVGARVSADLRQPGSRARWIDQRCVVDGGEFYNVCVLIAGHHVDLQRCYVYGEAGSGRVLVRNGFDDLGQPIAFLPWFYTADSVESSDRDWDSGVGTYTYGVTDFDAAFTSAFGDGGLDGDVNVVASGTNNPELHIAWVDDEDLGRGGLAGDAGSVLEYLVRRMGLPVDAGMFAAAKQLLTTYRLDFAIDESCVVWDFIKSQLLPALPVSLVVGPLGVYPLVWRFDATAGDAVEHFNLDTATDVERLGGIETDTSQLCNELTIKYARNSRTGSTAAAVTFGGKAYDSARGDELPEPTFRRSQQRLRDLNGQPLVLHRDLELPVVSRDSTAAAVAGWYAAAFGLPVRRLRLVADESRCQHISEGANVTVTDSRVRLDEAVCMVEEIVYGTDAPLELRLVMLGARERSCG
jgi:hypothetical protein